MSKGIYVFLPLSEDLSSLNSRFELYENGNYLVTFSRLSFRSDFETLGRGNNWIGSILRLFLTTYLSLTPALFSRTLHQAALW
jgi:hypothetical protein